MDKFNLQNILSFSKNLKILYVEDDMDMRIQTIKMLSNFFDNITVAVDGEKGLELYRNYFFDTNNYYDIVVSDMKMPKLDGIDMSKEIYKINAKQKIIIVSAYSDKKYLIDLINLGVERFMQKPISFELLTKIIFEVCFTFKNNDIIYLGENYTYNKKLGIVLKHNKKVKLTYSELKLTELLINNSKQNFNSKDIFNYIFFDQPFKNFSSDSIKSLVKRLRKKLPNGLIFNNRTIGYGINLPS